MDTAVGFNPNDMAVAVILLPPFIAVINQKRWSREVRGLVALGVCLVYAVVVTLLVGLPWASWRNIAWQVLLVTVAAYKLFWQPSNLTEKIEEVTDIGDHTPPAVDERRQVPPNGT
jgi:hypothetical protein